MSTSLPLANRASNVTVHPSLASAKARARALAVVSTSPARSFLDSPRFTESHAVAWTGSDAGWSRNHLNVTVKQRDLVRPPRSYRPAEERRPLRVLQIGLILHPFPLLLEVGVREHGRNRAAGRQGVHQGLHSIDPRQRVLADDIVGGHGTIVRELARFRSQPRICFPPPPALLAARA
jgi:hypothetical protein